jgi:hypothetical protein
VFVWRYMDQAGQEIGSSERFATREEAESWLGEDWTVLRDRGVEEVELLEDQEGESVYRMSLREASG